MAPRSKFCWNTRWIRSTRSCCNDPEVVHHGGNKPVEPVSAQEQAGLAALSRPMMPPNVSVRSLAGSVQQLQAWGNPPKGTQKRLVEE